MCLEWLKSFWGRLMELKEWASVKKEKYVRVFAFVTLVIVSYDVISDWINFSKWNSLSALQRKQVMSSGTWAALLTAAIVGTFMWIVAFCLFLTVCVRGGIDKESFKGDAGSHERTKREKIDKIIAIIEKIARVVTLLFEDLIVAATMVKLIVSFDNRMCKVTQFQEMTATTSKVALVGTLLSVIWGLYTFFSSPDYYAKDDSNRHFHEMAEKYGAKHELNTWQILVNAEGILSYFAVFCFTLFALVNVQFFPFEQSTRVFTGPLSPGMDAKPDEGIFIYQKYQSNVTIDSLPSNLTSFKKSFQTVYNRIYIGQFDELFDRYPDPVIRQLPCTSAMPFVSKMHNGTAKGGDFNYDFCVLIFTLSIKTEIHDFFSIEKFEESFSDVSFDSKETLEINVRYGMRMLGNDSNTCTAGPWNEYVSPLDFFVPQVVQDLVSYKCLTANQNCTEDDRRPPGGDTDTDTFTGDNNSVNLNSDTEPQNTTVTYDDDANRTVTSDPDTMTLTPEPNTVTLTPDPATDQTMKLEGMWLVIHDMPQPDSCFFLVTFDLANNICDSGYGDLAIKDSLPEVDVQYPQFITGNEE